MVICGNNDWGLSKFGMVSCYVAVAQSRILDYAGHVHSAKLKITLLQTTASNRATSVRY